jgi:hypothetical protein
MKKEEDGEEENRKGVVQIQEVGDVGLPLIPPGRHAGCLMQLSLNNYSASFSLPQKLAF